MAWNYDDLEAGGDGCQDFLLIGPREGRVIREERGEVADSFLLNFFLLRHQNLALFVIDYLVVSPMLKGGQVKKI